MCKRLLQQKISAYVLVNVICFYMASSALAQRTIYVDGSVVTTGNGSLASPFMTIGEAITASASGDEIRIAGGIYDNEPADVWLKGSQTIRGGYDIAFTTSDPSVTPTIIDMGRLTEQEQDRTFRCRGITSFTLENLTIQNSTSGEFGDTDNGGAMYIQNGSSGFIRGVSFINCASKFEGGVVIGPARDGGAVCIRDASTVVFEDCVFDGCTAVGRGGAINMRSAGAGNYVKIYRCLFTHCGSRNGASAVHDLDATSQIEIVNCIFANNGLDVVDSTGIYPSNYEISVADSRALIYNCTFVGSNNPDGFMFNIGNSSDAAAAKEIINCIVANNTIASGNSTFTIFNYASGYDDATKLENNLFFSNSDLEPLEPTGVTIIDANGNIAGDPQFADAANGDYHLKADSPGEDAGQTLALVPDDFARTLRPVGSAYDIGAFEGQSMNPKVRSVIATASSSVNANFGPTNTVNESGLNAWGQHDTTPTNMWLSIADQAPPVWIQYEFDIVYKLNQMWVWNSNNALEPIDGLGGLGVKTATIEYSTDGATWTALADVPEFTQATGTDDYTHNTTVDFNGFAAKFVRITCTSSWGGADQYGLSEVRFFYIPVMARDPYPSNGAEGVSLDVTLSWKAGLEAAEHNVYISDDEQSVIDGTAPIETVSQTAYGPLSLDLASTYYWRVDEVNNINVVPIWEGNIWSFTTREYLVVENFEDYNDYPPNEIWNTWIDGYGVATNGATTGYPSPDFNAGEHYMETKIVHGGIQSMPLLYDNTGGVNNSEASRTFGAAQQDWTRLGTNTLTLYVYGQAGNVGGQFYVKVNDVEKAANVNFTAESWQEVSIELASFGVNLQRVTSLAISIKGAGSGMVFIDDIRLVAPFE